MSYQSDKDGKASIRQKRMERLQQYMRGRTDPTTFPTNHTVLLELGYVTQGSTEQEQKTALRQFQGDLRFARTDDPEGFLIWADYVSHPTVKGWRIVNGEADAIWMFRRRNKDTRDRINAERREERSERHFAGYARRHPAEAAQVERMLREALENR